MSSGPIGRLSYPPNGGGGGAGDVAGPSSSTDNALARFDAATGKILQDGPVVESDAGALSGVTLLTVDNLRFDGNTLSSIDTNGDVLVVPNGAGRLQAPTFVALGGLTGSFPALKRSASGITVRLADDSAAAPLTCGTLDAQGTASMRQVEIGNGFQATFSDGADRNRGLGAITGAQGVRITNGSTGIGVMQCSRLVEANTAGAGSPNLLTTNESRGLQHNTGVTAENYHTLPPGAPIGWEQDFACQNTNGIRVVAQAGEVISVGPGVVSSAGGYVESFVAESLITLEKITATKYISRGIVGTWTAA